MVHLKINKVSMIDASFSFNHQTIREEFWSKRKIFNMLKITINPKQISGAYKESFNFFLLFFIYKSLINQTISDL